MLAVYALAVAVCLGWCIVQDLEAARKRKAAHEYRARLATALRAAQNRILSTKTPKDI